MEKNNRYFVKLDLVRIISCILILLYHLNIIHGGFLAVCTFFVLSGYLECMKALTEKKFSIKNYYIQRLKKLYLPLLIVVFGTLIIVKLNSSIRFLNLKRETISILFGYHNFWQLMMKVNYFTKHISSPFIHLWYLSILMQFDLVFPIIFSLFHKFNRLISTILIFILFVITTIIFYYMSYHADIMFVYYHTMTRVFSLLAGVFLAIMHYYYTKKVVTFKNFNWLIWVVYLFGFILLCLLVTNKNYAIYMVLVTILSMRMITYSVLKNQKKSKLISFLASGTYEVYLVQYPIIYLIQNLYHFHVLVIILIIIVVASVLHWIICYDFKIKFLYWVRVFIFGIIIVIGSYIVITEHDYMKEMEKLENKLNENTIKIEKANEEYQNQILNEEEEWKKILESQENKEKMISEMVRGLPVVGIGDSVLLGAIDGMYNVFPNGYFDGKVSRTILNAEELLKQLKSDGKLGNIVILSLANNGDYSYRRNKELMDILGDREVYWVNAVGADDPTFNDQFRLFAKDYSNIHIVEWDVVSKSHPEYFYADGIHVKGSGVSAYANTIYEVIYCDYLKKLEDETKKMMEEHDSIVQQKIVFYGNEILIRSFDDIRDKFKDSAFYVKKNYSFQNLYRDIKDKVDHGTLEYKIVFVFDDKIKKNEYRELIQLCEGHQIYICNVKEDVIFDDNNVHMILFYDELKKHKDYVLEFDDQLSDKGNKALADMLFDAIQ